ncbi:MAG: hypothetical protein U0942_02935 [Parvibaculum sp.]|uniref:hypothetical protein n=1 Tax=Parvibaculum sp. TaxID=2024848 RepID=UPI002AB93064|nr:hypothetical protein [Parvibaculum sp.]MDZ4380276.1 hypothetical protein [Parvibaculum sp.]
MSGSARNAELSRAVMLAAAGAGLIGLNQQMPGSSAGMVLLVLGGVGVAVGLALVVRAFFKRSGGAS